MHRMMESNGADTHNMRHTGFILSVGNISISGFHSECVFEDYMSERWH